MRLTVTILHVEDPVLLEDRTEHGLDNDARSGVRDEGRLLMQLLGEEVDTEVAVLAGGRRGGDADHLARTALEHEEVADADMVAGDGDRVGDNGGAAGRGTRGTRLRGRLDTLDGVALLAVVAAAGVWENLVSELMDTLAEGMIMTWTPSR